MQEFARHTHFKKDCQYRQQEKANFTKNTKSYKLFYSVYSTNLESKDIWYLDCRCSNHMTSNKSYFIKVEEHINSEVTLGDGKVQKVERRGTIVVRITNGQ